MGFTTITSVPNNTNWAIIKYNNNGNLFHIQYYDTPKPDSVDHTETIVVDASDTLYLKVSGIGQHNMIIAQ